MVSAFASFKFGVAFCFTQLISVLMVFYVRISINQRRYYSKAKTTFKDFAILAQIGTEPSDNQYLVVDIGLAAVPILMIGNTAPHHKLVKRKPTRYTSNNIILLVSKSCQE